MEHPAISFLRLLDPAPSARYIVECYTDVKPTIGDLRHPPRHRGPIALVSCTTDDKALRLKRMPADVAEMFGYDVLQRSVARPRSGVATRQPSA